MRITAIILTYNRPRYLRVAVESVLNQVRSVDEIIVVDDGSEDGQAQGIVSQFGGKVRYLRQSNRGPAAARNAGIRAASGDWLAFLDDDDWWLPEKILRQEQALTHSPEAILAYTGLWFESSAGGLVLGEFRDPTRLWPTLRMRNTIPPSAVLVRKDVVLRAGGFTEHLKGSEDWDLWVRLRLRHSFTAVREPLTVYRLGPSSLSKGIERMLIDSETMLETTLLSGLDGWERRLWRRRIRSVQLFSAAISAREVGSRQEYGFLRDSLLQWPAPWFLPKRYIALALNLLNSWR